MSIWVDADSCPASIKEILCRAANRSKTTATFIANHYVPLPKSPYILSRQVSAGFDVADNEIVKEVQPGDLVITNDIPLAAEVIDKNALALGHRGMQFTKENVKSQLNMRDFLDTMRASGVQTGGPPALSQTDRQQFANALDRYLVKSAKD